MANKKRRRIDSPRGRQISVEAARERLQWTAEFLEEQTGPHDDGLREVASGLRAFLKGEYRTLDVALGIVKTRGAPKSKTASHKGTARIIYKHWKGHKRGNDDIDWAAVQLALQRPDGSEPDERELRRIWNTYKASLIAEAVIAKMKKRG